MKKYILSLIMIGMSLATNAQDAYHLSLSNLLQNDFNLVPGEWVFANTESAIINDAYNYGATTSVQNAVGQEFTQKFHMQILLQQV